MLLANGKVISANSTENSDLFRALKGGGSNFGDFQGSLSCRRVKANVSRYQGIVTRFDLQTYPLIKVQATISLYNPQDYVEIIKATVSVQEEMEKDPNIGLFCNFNVGFVAVGMIYAKGTDEQQTAFEPFHNLTSLISEVMPRTNGTLLSLAKSMSHSSDLKKYVYNLQINSFDLTRTKSDEITGGLFTRLPQRFRKSCTKTLTAHGLMSVRLYQLVLYFISPFSQWVRSVSRKVKITEETFWAWRMSLKAVRLYSPVLVSPQDIPIVKC